MKIRKNLRFVLFVPLLLFLGGIGIGMFFGLIGYYASTWLGIFETQSQNEMVFWLFACMGIISGSILSIQSFFR